MTPQAAARAVSMLNAAAFDRFVEIFFAHTYGSENFHAVAVPGGGVFDRTLTYDQYPDVQSPYRALYITHQSPAELFENSKSVPFSDDGWRAKLHASLASLSDSFLNGLGQIERRLKAVYFVTNHYGHTKRDYLKHLLPQYRKLVAHLELGDDAVGVGSADSFLAAGRPEALVRSVETFLDIDHDGVCIGLSPDEITVRSYSEQRELATGVTRSSREPCQSVIVDRGSELNSAMQEFEQLLRRDARESELEAFLVEHFRDVFGPQYDTIRAQIWLRFPHLDINGKNRRTDLFVHNAVNNDWELFEIKRAIPMLGSEYRSIPQFAHEIHGAIAQVKNYHDILSQDSVRRHFAKQGIDYYQPVLHLVAGRRPQISQEQWRRLVAQVDSRVKLIVFDDLMRELQLRYDDFRASSLRSSNPG